jgi:hypothetical protein
MINFSQLHKAKEGWSSILKVTHGAITPLTLKNQCHNSKNWFVTEYKYEFSKT